MLCYFFFKAALGQRHEQKGALQCSQKVNKDSMIPKNGKGSNQRTFKFSESNTFYSQ